MTQSLFDIYTTAPASSESSPADFVRSVRDVTQWTEDAGLTGMLVYTDNTLLDPWLTAQSIISQSRRVAPLVAVQPAYMHPYTAARMVASIALMHERPVHLNLVAGGFAGHLIALGDDASHDNRYQRLTEYATVVKRLLAGPGAVTFNGDHYRLKKATLPYRVPDALQPRFFVSGSSVASAQSAELLGCTRLTYPPPPDEFPERPHGGIRLGVIARPDGAPAWRLAHERFPADPAGERLHRVSAQLSGSSWQTDLAARPAEAAEQSPYWLHPFRSYKTFCPYLVGSYADVRRLLHDYWRKGVRTLVLDVPKSAEELQHTLAACAGPVPAEPVP